MFIGFTRISWWALRRPGHWSAAHTWYHPDFIFVIFDLGFLDSWDLEPILLKFDQSGAKMCSSPWASGMALRKLTYGSFRFWVSLLTKKRGVPESSISSQYAPKGVPGTPKIRSRMPPDPRLSRFCESLVFVQHSIDFFMFYPVQGYPGRPKTSVLTVPWNSL